MVGHQIVHSIDYCLDRPSLMLKEEGKRGKEAQAMETIKKRRKKIHF